MSEDQEKKSETGFVSSAQEPRLKKVARWFIMATVPFIVIFLAHKLLTFPDTLREHSKKDKAVESKAEQVDEATWPKVIAQNIEERVYVRAVKREAATGDQESTRMTEIPDHYWVGSKLFQNESGSCRLETVKLIGVQELEGVQLLNKVTVGKPVPCDTPLPEIDNAH